MPADPFAEEQLWALPERQDFNVSVVFAGKESPRRGLNRLWWAGLGLLVQSVQDERFPTARKIHNALLEDMGYVTKIWRIDKTYRLEADSVAFDEMSDEDFATLFEQARGIVYREWGIDPWSLWKQLKDFNKRG